MSSIHELLRYLARPDVAELALGTGRVPAVKMGGAYRGIAKTELSSDEILAMLRETGAPDGELGEKPVQWATQAAGVGGVSITALRRGDQIQARFSVVRAAQGQEAAAAAPVVAKPAAATTPGPPLVSPSHGAAPTLGAHRSAPAHPAGRPSAAAGVGTAPSTRPPGAGFVPMAPTGNPSAASARSALATASAPAAPPSTAYVHTPPAAATAAAPAPAFGAPSTGAAFSAQDRYAGFEAMLEAARSRAASDLHVVAGRPVLFRIAGELLPSGEPITAEAAEAMLLPCVPERLRAQLEREGSCDFALQHPSAGRFRVNIGRQRTGLKACLRVIPREIPTLESLGLPPSIGGATHHHQGLIILTGPSGHGKTTTLAAVVDIVNSTTSHHVITVEDPVEYVHPTKMAMMSQREVGSHTKSFQSALKGSLREDPDVIVVGELRDTETVRMALSAGETGHLLIATMNTPNAAKTIDRLIDLFPPADQGQVRMSLSSGLRMIVSQRLVPNADGTGVVVAAEVLPGSVALGNLIRDEKTYQIPSLQQRGKSMGIIRLDDSLAELVALGKTTLEIAKTYADTPDDLATMVNAYKAAAAPQPPPDLTKKPPDGKLMGKMGSLMGRK